VRTQTGTAQGELEVLRVALEHFRRDCGHYPPPKQGLALLVSDTNTPNWKGPYISLLKNDPWFSPYFYSWDGSNVVLNALGPDRLMHTRDDIQTPTNWVSNDALL
jgi:type II secretion system protein G